MAKSIIVVLLMSLPTIYFFFNRSSVQSRQAENRCGEEGAGKPWFVSVTQSLLLYKERRE